VITLEQLIRGERSYYASDDLGIVQSRHNFLHFGAGVNP
jgi:hypothetical protein